ncbi:MAG: hypothetical protein KF768_07905 [Phycisphaeraceae bacterium]|nr:hypothetical protein [Phycisphaeraceae bacterium]
MNVKSISVILLVTAAGLLFASCGECRECGTVAVGAEGAPSDGMPSTRIELVRVANTYCVVSPEDMVSPNRLTIPDLTREFGGVVYGLCCDGCLKVWDDSTDEERRRMVARTMAREPE